MSVILQNPIQQYAKKLWEFVRISYVADGACGVILAKCTNTNPKYLVQLQSFLKKNEPQLAVECYFDDTTEVLSIVLEGVKLSGTHYTALVCKDFLERHDLLDGQIIVASFPECGNPEENLLTKLFHAVTDRTGNRKFIRIFSDQVQEKSVSSILIADPDENSREFIKLRLELQGNRVYEAKDGHEALEAFTQLSPDVVITALHLPFVDGYRIIRKIREEHEKKAKIIVLTENRMTKDVNRAFELGASDVVTKPFSMPELEWRIKKLQYA